ncbi:MAG: dihydrofolate reductase [Piccolia ochrophora]|nr:MAG: dihydrofolate reductase [Piccolia ochrophora]
MPPSPPPIPLTAIVAVTHNNGIGCRGTLPWPQLKPDMSYFARVTARRPPSHPDARNAVIMGRRTWDSIPQRFRPLKDRLNVVLSRSAGFEDHSAPGTEVLSAKSMPDALRLLGDKQSKGELGRAFVIGGVEVYKAAMDMEQGPVERLLVTRVDGDWECDVFFPVDVHEQNGWKKTSAAELEEWSGETNMEGVKDDKGVGFEFEMWLKEGAEAG